MRRQEKEIREPEAIESVIAAAQVCRVAMCDGDRPYVVPMCFGYADGMFYLHSAREGRKLEILGRNDRVCLELEDGLSVTPGTSACKWGMAFRSVVAFGRAEEVESPEERRRALDLIMARYAPAGPYDYADAVLARTVVLRVRVEHMTGKRSG
jgi:nitroimidazol reductase NimA-like FMN-containing flavoprotein (pyridoxamine 5'-phosphate oxidase superfamily)